MLMNDKEKFNILHLIDSLEPGGAERVAVNLANELSIRGHIVSFCATRKEGFLRELLVPSINYFFAKKRVFFDIFSLCRLYKFAKKNRVQIIHAHGTSLLFAVALRRLLSGVKVIWHDHYGAYEIKKRSTLIYKLLARDVNTIIVVTNDLAKWAEEQLNVEQSVIEYLPNFVIQNTNFQKVDLIGIDGYRIVCVANFRLQKDHLTLIRALHKVVGVENRAHLFLIGKRNDQDIFNEVLLEIHKLGLENSVSIIGERNDVQNILSSCDIGVLSSSSEGFPLALLEYGVNALPVVVTDVGECRKIVINDYFGLVVPPQNPEAMAEAILSLLNSHELQVSIGQRLKTRIDIEYSKNAVLEKLELIYATTIS